MKIFHGRAFTNKEKIDGKEVLGNPASVVVCEKVLPSDEEMSKIAIEQAQPMTVFVSKRDGDEFDVRYFSPNGKKFSLCGHATLITSYFINKIYGNSHINFCLNGCCNDSSSDILESEIKSNGIIMINMPAYMPMLSDNKDCINNYLKALFLRKEEVEGFYYCRELKDFIIVLKDKNKLRSISPDLDLLSGVSSKNNIRGIFVTSKSSCKNADYEVRIFAPHLGINEDISCGSAQCSLLPLWGKLLNVNEKKEFKIICPYNGIQYYGGVEFGNYLVKEKKILIGGFVDIKNNLT